MPKFLITPSLYSSYVYYAETDFSVYGDSADEWAKKAYEDWLNCLNKVQTPTTEAQQRGIDFENAVHALSSGEPEKTEFADDKEEAEYATAREIAAKVKGGMWQEVLKKETKDYLLYGRADVILRNHIYDIKRVSQYEVGKYQKSIQHLLYLECAGLDNFEYLVSDGRNVYAEYYQREPDNLQKLLGKIDGMVDFISSVPEFAVPFLTKWSAK